MLAVEKRVTSPLLVRVASPASPPRRHPRQDMVTRHVAANRTCCQSNHAHISAVQTSASECVPCWQEPSSIEKVAEVDTHIGCAMSGLTADARTLIDHGRVEAQVRCTRRQASQRASEWPQPVVRRDCSANTWHSTLGTSLLQLRIRNRSKPMARPIQLLGLDVRLQTGTRPLTCLRPDAQQHRFTYNEPMPVESCTQSLCDLALQFGEDDEEGGMVRLPMHSRYTSALVRWQSACPAGVRPHY